MKKPKLAPHKTKGWVACYSDSYGVSLHEATDFAGIAICEHGQQGPGPVYASVPDALLALWRSTNAEHAKFRKAVRDAVTAENSRQKEST